MRVLVFHGYLLRGTGSNVFNASLAAAFLRLGHEVHLLAQERHAHELEFVGAVGDWELGTLRVERVRELPCTVYRPPIGQLLPVYVHDDYEGITARIFPDFTDPELDAYLAANVEAVAEVAACARPELALANHVIMGPAILARALAGTGIPFAVQVHGSALEYTVKPHPRFLPFAREGIAAAAGVLVSSRHTAQSLWSALAEDSLPERTGFGPPGVDTHLFRPLSKPVAVAQAQSLAARLADHADASLQASSFSRDQADASHAVARLAEQGTRDPIVAFVGKLILAKGIDLLLAAWPRVLSQEPGARLAVIGFGAYAEPARRMAAALAEGDLRSVRELAQAGGRAEGNPAKPLRFLNAFLDRLESAAERGRYFEAATAMPEAVTFTGRLEHDELASVLPLCEAIVVPSTFPEAFGMVAAEAAACGVLPICAAHSGLAEVSGRLAEAVPRPVARLLSFELDELAVESIADSVVRWLRTAKDVRAQARARLVDAAAGHYSWEQTALRVLAATQGRLESFPQ